MLSEDAALHGPMDPERFAADCETLGTDAYAISKAANGICMHAFACFAEFCRPELGYSYNTPQYVVEAKTPEDISKAILFAKSYEIQVSVKTTGHSYQGASTSRNSLLIWMQNYPKDNNITVNFTDSCGTEYDQVIGINGGTVWNDVIEAVGRKYQYAAGSGRTVSAAGGWLQGVGLSFSARQYGAGVDNVITFDVVLANGTQVRADACSNPDLFWALRGGGGGTFGVVTHVHYRVHPVTEVQLVSWFLLGTPPTEEQALLFARQWLSYWIQVSPTLDTRWSGFWNGAGCYLVFVGSKEDALTTFVNSFNTWYETELTTSEFEADVWGAYPPISAIESFDSWFDFRGGEDCVGGKPDCTDQTGDAYNGVEYFAARLMPQDVVVNKPNETLEMLMTLVEIGGLGPVNYYLGGHMMNATSNATAVHPAMRKALWAVHSNYPAASEIVRQFIPNNVTGASFNHHATDEPEWRTALWGDNYKQLLDLKDVYDPDHVFRCWHCVGYDGTEVGEVPVPAPSCPTGSPTTMTSTLTPSMIASVAPTAVPAPPVSSTIIPTTIMPTDAATTPSTSMIKQPSSGAPLLLSMFWRLLFMMCCCPLFF